MSFDITKKLKNFHTDLTKYRLDRVADLNANPFDLAKQNLKLLEKDDEEKRMQILKKIYIIGWLFALLYK